MKPLIVLISSFLLATLLIKIVKKKLDIKHAARIAMSIMLCFTAIGHFAFPKGMSMMIPDLIPFKLGLVYITGVLEIILAIGLMIPKFQRLTGWITVIFLLLVLPANINAAIQHVNYQTGELNGKGFSYLWFRVPLQFLFMGWTYFASIRKP